jgi:hypothetical protein
MPKKIDYTGQRFARRRVLGFHGRDKHRHAVWDVECDCGRVLTSLTQNLRRTRGCPFCSHKEPRPYRRKRPYENIYNTLVQRARHSVNITYEQFVHFTQTGECHYCGVPLVWSEYRNKSNTSATNLDRKNNDLPYEFDNIVVCCLRCNYAKNTHFTYEEWKKLGDVIRSWKK